MPPTVSSHRLAASLHSAAAGDGFLCNFDVSYDHRCHLSPTVHSDPTGSRARARQVIALSIVLVDEML